MKEIKQRINEPTPKFFKKLRQWALLAACIAAGATPVLNAIGLTTAAVIVGAVGSGAAGVAAAAFLPSEKR